METGRLSFPLDRLEEIADCFNVPVATFFSDGDFDETRLLYAWKALKGKTALTRRDLRAHK